MKKRLSLPIAALMLLATTLFIIGCGAKTPAVVEAPAPEKTAEAPPAPVAPEVPEAPETPASPEAAQPPAPEVPVVPETAEVPVVPETPETAPAPSEMTEAGLPADSVLNMVPAETAGLIYFPSLMALNDSINTLAMELMPVADSPEVLAMILAESFGAGFSDLSELEQIGLSLERDFVIFTPAFDPLRLSAVIHLTDPAAMQQVIDAEAEGGLPIEHNGVHYWNAAGAEGSFAIIEDMLVFSQSAEVCKNVIDTYKQTTPAVTMNPDYAVFLTDVTAGDVHLAMHLNLEAIVPMLQKRVMSETDSLTDALESDPSVMDAAPNVQSIAGVVTGMLSQLKSLDATLAIDGTDVRLTPFLRFKSGSDIQHKLAKMAPNELRLLEGLPTSAFMNGSLQGDPDLMVEMSTFWMKFFIHESDTEQMARFQALMQQMHGFYEALGEEWAFSVGFGDSILPDYSVTYHVKDAQQAEAYMADRFLKQFQETMLFMRNIIGESSAAMDMYAGAHPGDSIMHNGVEIRSYVFPNFGTIFQDMPPEAMRMFPNEWRWYYAFAGPHLFLTTGSLELLKLNMDNRTGINTLPAFSEEPSYEKLAKHLDLESNLFFALSPVTLVKDLLPIIGGMSDPNTAAAMQMLSGMLMNLPESYSIGMSLRAEESGVRTQLLLALGDFRQLIQLVMMMEGMEQMQ